MFLTAEILKKMLSRRYRIMPDNLPSNPSFCGFRFYDGSEPQKDHLCIISPEDLAFLRPDNEPGIFLCNGTGTETEELCLPEGFTVLCLENRVDSSELINVLNEIFEEIENWEESLTRLTPDVSDIRNALNESRKLLRGSIILADNRFHYIAYTDDFRGNAALIQTIEGIPKYVMEDILTDPAYQAVQTSRSVMLYQVHTARQVVPALCYNLFKKDSSIYNARIMLASKEAFTPDQYDLLKILGDRLADVLWQIAPFSFPIPAFSSLHHAVASCLKEEPASRPLVHAILRMVHWSAQDRYVLALFSPYFIREKDEINAVSVNQLELLFPNSCGVIINQRVALLVNLGSKKEQGHFRFQENIATFLRDSLYKAGISSEFDDFFRIRYALHEAESAMRIGNIRDSMYWYYRFPDYALAYTLDHASRDVYYKDLVNQPLLDLLDYDREHSSSLAHTLEQYIKNKFNVTHTAAALYLNRSTVLAHLKKIEELTSLNLDDWHTHLHLLLSFALLENE